MTRGLKSENWPDFGFWSSLNTPNEGPRDQSEVPGSALAVISCEELPDTPQSSFARVPEGLVRLPNLCVREPDSIPIYG